MNNLTRVDLRVLSQFISTSYLAEFTKPGNKDSKARLKKFLAKKRLELDDDRTLGNVLDQLYALLLNNYRNEYTYKNELVKNLVADKFKRSETIILNEFKVGKSIVDTVLLNGIDKAFEIKTELDNPDRLITQLQDYKKVFKNVYLVTHNNILNKYLSLLSDEVGIIAFHNDMSLEVIRDAKEHISDLCIETMMRCLRKSEYLHITNLFFERIPEVSDFDLFKTCLLWVKKLDARDFQSEFISILKRRRLNNDEGCDIESIPHSVRYAYHSLNLSQNQYIGFVNSLNSKKI